MTPNRWLLGVYESRCRQRPRYSLRSFAKTLALPPGRVSEFFAGKRRLTSAMAERISDRLGLAPSERSELMQMVIASKPSSQLATSSPGELLTDDQFSAIADWYHFAILSLMEVPDFRDEPAWIGRRLGIAPQLATAALARLERLQLIRHNGSRWVLTKRNLATPDDITSAALRHSHRQSLVQALAALDEVPVEWRDISSITFTVAKNKIPKAKKMIRDFRRSFAEAMERGTSEEVYNLCVQLVPVTKSNFEEKNEAGESQ